MATRTYWAVQIIGALILTFVLANTSCNAALTTSLLGDANEEIGCGQHCDKTPKLRIKHSTLLPKYSLGLKPQPSRQILKKREVAASKIFTISPNDGVFMFPFASHTKFIDKQLQLLKKRKILKPQKSLFDYDTGKISIPLDNHSKHPDTYKWLYIDAFTRGGMYEGYVRLGELKMHEKMGPYYDGLQNFKQDWFVKEGAEKPREDAEEYMTSIKAHQLHTDEMYEKLVEAHTYDPTEMTTMVKIAEFGSPPLNVKQMTYIDAYVKQSIWEQSIFPYLLKQRPDSYALALSSVNLAISLIYMSLNVWMKDIIDSSNLVHISMQGTQYLHMFLDAENGDYKCHSPELVTSKLVKSYTKFEKNMEVRSQMEDDIGRIANNLYKIHLMPVAKHIFTTYSLLAKAINDDEELRSLIYGIKVALSLLHFKTSYEQEETYPFIVVYVRASRADMEKGPFGCAEAVKRNTERIIELLIDHLAPYFVFGSDVAPRFNHRINSLIWVANGDGDKKASLIERQDLEALDPSVDLTAKEIERPVTRYAFYQLVTPVKSRFGALSKFSFHLNMKMLHEYSAHKAIVVQLCPYAMEIKGDKTYNLFQKDPFHFRFAFKFVSQSHREAIYQSENVKYGRGWEKLDSDSAMPHVTNWRYYYTITCKCPLKKQQKVNVLIGDHEDDDELPMTCVLTQTSSSGKVKTSSSWEWTDGMKALPKVVKDTLSGWGYKSITESSVANKRDCIAPNM